MSESHGKGRTLSTGARRKVARHKTRAELGREAPKVTIGKLERIQVKARGNVTKQSLRKADVMNVLDPATGKTRQAKIVTVSANSANRHYVRMNILSKGAVVKTDIGEARITSRPGQHGVINGILVKKA